MPDRRDRDSGTGLGATLRRLVDLLAEMEEDGDRERSGSWWSSRGDYSVGVDYSVRTGLNDRPTGAPGRADADRGDADARTGRPTDDYLVDAYREGDELVVACDLPGVDEDDLTLGFDADAPAVVVGVRDQEVDRVPVEWDAVEVVGSRWNNQVLEVRLREADDDQRA